MEIFSLQKIRYRKNQNRNISQQIFIFILHEFSSKLLFETKRMYRIKITILVRALHFLKGKKLKKTK